MYIMSKYYLALVAALGFLAAPAWAQGYGCWGGQVASYGCYGGWQSAGYSAGWQSAGCYGGGWRVAGSWGTPTSYGCYGSGCYGGVSVGYGYYPSGCMGSVPAYTSGYPVSGCYGSQPVVSAGYYSSGCYGGVPVVSSGCTGGTAVASSSSGYAVPSTPPVPVKSRVVSREEVSREEVSGKVQPAKHRQEAPKEHLKASDKQQVETLDLPEGEAKGPATAKIVVQMPAGAKLSINQKACQGSSSTRTFVSPPLEPGKDYYYTFKAEVVRDSETVTATQRVAVRAGEEKQVRLELPPASSQ